MNTELVQWQIMDESCGCVFPWFTHPFLEVLKTWDLKDKTVLEYGGGRSTAWWAAKANRIICVENKHEWAESIIAELRGGSGKWVMLEAPCDEGDTDAFRRSEYITIPRLISIPIDIIVVDGILRFECMEFGIKLLREAGGILIVDNWQQDGFVCPACAELVKDYEGHIYRQEDHTDHHGNKWQTGYWKIPAA